MTGWRQFPTGGPRAVENGIKARSARGGIGESWWSKRFVDVLESLAMGGRLTRGRAYARRGQVISLDVAPGLVSAAVQGSRATPYDVTVAFAPLSELVWAKVEIALSEQSLASAKLLAGEMPPALEQIFADAGAPLFPRTVRDLVQRCSCPDVEVPCKHLAATFYLLAEALDADPFLLLTWRGRDRERLLARLRVLRSSGSAGDSEIPAESAEGGSTTPAAEPDRPVAGAALALAGLDLPAADPDRFWLPPPPLPPRPAAVHADPDLLLRQLPAPGPELGAEALDLRLRAVYRRFAEPDG